MFFFSLNWQQHPWVNLTPQAQYTFWQNLGHESSEPVCVFWKRLKFSSLSPERVKGQRGWSPCLFVRPCFALRAHLQRLALRRPRADNPVTTVRPLDPETDGFSLLLFCYPHSMFTDEWKGESSCCLCLHIDSWFGLRIFLKCGQEPLNISWQYRLIFAIFVQCHIVNHSSMMWTHSG